MKRLGRPHEDVVSAIGRVEAKVVKHPLQFARDIVSLFFRCTVIFLGCPLNIYAVLIGACKKKGIKAALPLKTSNDVGDYRRIKMPQMRQAVRIVDRRRDVKRFHQKR